MSPINVIIVGLRLLAVYCFVQVIPLFSTMGLVAALYGRNQFPASIFETLLPGGSLLVSGIILFIFSEPLARRITPLPSADAKENVCSFEQLQALAFAVAGILILGTSLPHFGRALQDLFILYSHHKQGDAIPGESVLSNGLYSAGVVAQLVVGALLLLNPNGFRNVWRYLRTAGT